MRITNISSSIASVVCRVINSVAVAGVAVRMFLHLTFTREHMGYWLELCQPRLAWGGNDACYQPVDLKPGNKPGLWREGITAPAVCLAPSRLASAQVSRRR